MVIMRHNSTVDQKIKRRKSLRTGGNLESFKEEIDKTGVRMSLSLFVELCEIMKKDIFELKHYKISIKHVFVIHLLLLLVLC